MFTTLKFKWFNLVDFSSEKVDNLCMCMNLHCKDLKSLVIS